MFMIGGTLKDQLVQSPSWSRKVSSYVTGLLKGRLIGLTHDSAKACSSQNL